MNPTVTPSGMTRWRPDSTRVRVNGGNGCDPCLFDDDLAARLATFTANP